MCYYHCCNYYCYERQYSAEILCSSHLRGQTQGSCLSSEIHSHEQEYLCESLSSVKLENIPNSYSPPIWTSPFPVHYIYLTGVAGLIIYKRLPPGQFLLLSVALEYVSLAELPYTVSSSEILGQVASSVAYYIYRTASVVNKEDINVKRGSNT